MPKAELPERLETERLVLRVRTVADAEDIHAYASLPEVAYQQVFRPSRPWKMRFIIWSISFQNAIKRTISQQAMGLLLKGLIKSLALLILTIAMRMMC